MKNVAIGQSVSHMKIPAIVALVLASSMSLSLGGCTMSDTGKRVGSGAAIGAAGGALLGSSREAAVIGAAVGAAGGYIFDQHKKGDDAEAENERLRRENEQLRQQQVGSQ